MRLLIFGGTSFVGRHLVDAALAAGDEVTLANRGQTNPGLFDGVETRIIDRDTDDLSALADGEWDATIDVTAYVPRHVSAVAYELSGRGGRYVLVSTASVYDPAGMADRSENCRRHLPELKSEEVTSDAYGPLKVACEDVAWSSFGDRGSIVRPGIVAGPHDPTDRFTYWVRRLAQDRPVVVSRRPDQPVQVIDARDLAAFLRLVAASEHSDTYNATGQETPLAGFLRAVASGVGAPEPEVLWADTSWLSERQAARQPLVLDVGWDVDGLFQRSNDRAKAFGLSIRPLEETAADTWAWDRARGLPPLSVGPAPDAELALVEAWRERS